MKRRTRTIWHSDNGLCYEMRRHFTRSVAEQKARAFAKNPSFRLTAVRPVKEGVFAVRLYPADHTALYERCVKMSEEKAGEEGSKYRVRPAPDGNGWMIRNTEKGTEYRVTGPPEVTCECPWWRRNLAQLGAPCKHLTEMRRRGYFEPDLELVG